MEITKVLEITKVHTISETYREQVLLLKMQLSAS